MASSQSQGIQTLLEAEKEAAKVVQQARQYRLQRLKDARSQAQKEIEEYRKTKDEEFRKIESQRKGLIETAQAAVDKETGAKLKVVQESLAKTRGAVVKKLLDRVVLVRPELHRNLTKLQSQ